MDFKGKTIAITGAASGIGRATALLLGERGARLSLADKDTNELAKFTNLLVDKKIDARFWSVNVTDPAAVQKWIENTAKSMGLLDGMFARFEIMI